MLYIVYGEIDLVVILSVSLIDILGFFYQPSHCHIYTYIGALMVLFCVLIYCIFHQWCFVRVTFITRGECEMVLSAIEYKSR